MTNLRWEQAVIKEITHARSARDAGKEGMARVCARRAAGIAIGEYLAVNALPNPGPSAVDRLRYLPTVPGMAAEAKQAAELLTVRVNTNHELPITADLIAEALQLVHALFPDFPFAKE